MCGISGMFGNADQATALAMAACLRHRGPDGSGGFYDELEHGSVAFGHARLSIVDIEGSSQPIESDHGAVLVQNGEITINWNCALDAMPIHGVLQETVKQF